MSSNTLSNVQKKIATLANERYNNPKTSLITFHFKPQLLSSTEEKLKRASIAYGSIAGKDIYLFDHFLNELEGKNLRDYSQNAQFSRTSYGSPESIEKGERPARSMNNKERWLFFSKPPEAVIEIYKLLSHISHQIDAEISTLPWELCDQKTGSPAVIANFLESLSPESMNLGKHQDSNPKEGIAFNVPKLFSDKEVHTNAFENGAVGKPWLISLMLYSTAENFDPNFSMGTVYYDQEGKICLRTNCLDTRLVLFEGDIWHSIEQSAIPQDIKTWRVSYVFKLIVNPKNETNSPKQKLRQWLNNVSPKINSLVLDQKTRI